MDKSKLEKAFNDALIASYGKGVKLVSPAKKSNFSKTGEGTIGDVLKQRHRQRKILFRFALWFVSLTTLYVLAMVSMQAYLNFHGYKATLIDPGVLKIIVTGLFVQFIGLLTIITRSIWNDKPYLEAGMFKKKKKPEDE
jgi:hypothetical protein